MSRTTTIRRGRTVAAFAVGAMVLLGACGSSDSSSDTTSSSSTSTTAAESTTTTKGGGESAETKRFDEEVQQWLIDVGCYSGSVDGIAGPETDAAIVAFQEAEGLTADGEVGAETEAALQKAADAGTKVCGASGGSTTTTKASGGSTTTTKVTPAGATCTATSLSEAVGETINSYVCSGGYAGVEYGTEADEQAVLKIEGTKWVDVTDETCGAASAGISPQVLEVGCSAATGTGSGDSTTTSGS